MGTAACTYTPTGAEAKQLDQKEGKSGRKGTNVPKRKKARKKRKKSDGDNNNDSNNNSNNNNTIHVAATCRLVDIWLCNLLVREFVSVGAAQSMFYSGRYSIAFQVVLLAIAGTALGLDQDISCEGGLDDVGSCSSDTRRLEAEQPTTWDNERGYIIACLAMGRFGNQLDQLLGSMHFAKRTGRVFVAPPLVTYNALDRGSRKASKSRYTFWPFEEVFNVTVANSYHPMITMEQFMDSFATTIKAGPQAEASYWLAPRTIYCIDRDKPNFAEADCRLEKGQVKGEFWSHYGVDPAAVAQRALSITYQNRDEDITRVASAAKVHVVLACVRFLLISQRQVDEPKKPPKTFCLCVRMGSIIVQIPVLALAGASQIAKFPALSTVRPVHR